MNHTLLQIIVAALALSPPLGGAEPNSDPVTNEASSQLPRQSAEIIARLADYEQQVLNEAKTKIAEKRIAVAKILKAHLHAETKRGNLEGALAIKSEVEKLEPEASRQPKGENDMEPLAMLLIGTKWTFWTNEEGHLDFLSEGKVKFSARKVAYRWEATGANTIRITTHTINPKIK